MALEDFGEICSKEGLDEEDAIRDIYKQANELLAKPLDFGDKEILLNIAIMLFDKSSKAFKYIVPGTAIERDKLATVFHPLDEAKEYTIFPADRPEIEDVDLEYVKIKKDVKIVSEDLKPSIDDFVKKY